MHITELKKDVDALKAGIGELVKQAADKVLASALDDFNNRIEAIEKRLEEAGI